MLTYRVIGWYPNIDARRRTSTNMSAVAVFSTMQLAQNYAFNMKMHLHSIRIIEKDPDDPEIDYLIKAKSGNP